MMKRRGLLFPMVCCWTRRLYVGSILRHQCKMLRIV